MSSHQNSTYNGDFFHLPGQSASAVRYVRPPARRAPTPRLAKTPDEIWGQYNNYRANGVTISAIVHVAVIGLLLSGVFVTHQVAIQEARQHVTLIAPSPETFAMPVAKKIASGGGGGGDRDPLPAPKGHLPKAAETAGR